MQLRGSFFVLFFYDVADRIDLDRLRQLLGAEPPRREPSFKHPVPEYVRFERPPIMEGADPIRLPAGDEFQTRIKYFEYGVVGVELERRFDGDWDELVRLSSRWIAAPELERAAADTIRARVERAKPALVQPYTTWLTEDYYVIQLRDAPGAEGKPLTAAEMLSGHGAHIAQIIRGESQPLADSERNDALQSSMSYYPADLLVVGWVAALVYDTPEGAAPTIQLLEHANTQLLEFRHYDDRLSRMLDNVYKMIDEHKGGPFRHWRMARRAERLNAMRVEVTELTERTDNAIKFLSDMFYARAYRVAATRVGAADYRTLVEHKLHIAGDLYSSIVAEFHEARAFLLEIVVIAILVVELIQAFRGGK